MSGLTKRMFALYCPRLPADTAGQPSTPTTKRSPRCSAAGEPSSTGTAGSSSSSPSSSASSARSAAGRAASVLSAGGWLDPGSESAAVADRLADEFGAGRGALIAVYRGADGADARSDGVPGGHRGVARRPRQGPRRVGDHRLRRDGRRPVHLQRRRVRLRRRRPERHRRGVGPADRPVRVRDRTSPATASSCCSAATPR